MVSVSTLRKIAGYGAVLSASGCFLLYYKLQYDWSELTRKETQWLRENERKVLNNDADEREATEEEIITTDDEEVDDIEREEEATQPKKPQPEIPVRKKKSIAVPTVKQRATVVSRGMAARTSSPASGHEAPMSYLPIMSPSETPTNCTDYLRKQFETIFLMLNKLTEQQHQLLQKMQHLEASFSSTGEKDDAEDQVLDGVFNLSTTVTPRREPPQKRCSFAEASPSTLPGGSPPSLPGGAPMNMASFDVVRKRLGLSKAAKQKENESCPTMPIPPNAWAMASEVQHKAVSFRNFAALFIITYFDNQALIGRICNGKGDRGLGAQKLDLIRALCWKLYPTDMAKPGAWRQCKMAIDEILRRGRRTIKRYTYASLQTNTRFSSGDFYRKPIEALRSDEKLCRALGTPVKSLFLNLGNKENFITDDKAQLCIPVRGTKYKGHLHSRCSKDPETNSWMIDSLELEVNEKIVPVKFTNKTSVEELTE